MPHGWERDALYSEKWDRLLPHAQAWWAELPRIAGVAWGWFERGFVQSAICDAGAFVADPSRVVGAVPLVRLALTRCSVAHISELGNAGLDALRQLEIYTGNYLQTGVHYGRTFEDALVALAECPSLAALQDLTLAVGRLSTLVRRTLGERFDRVTTL